MVIKFMLRSLLELVIKLLSKLENGCVVIVEELQNLLKWVVVVDKMF